MDKNCTIYQTVDFIGKKWTLLILLELYKNPTQPKRYSYLKKSLPKITPKILSTRLKELQSNKILTKTINSDSFPIKCEYTLTESGKDFINTIKSIKKWALKWKIENNECKNQDCSNCLL